jgi:hypothetical protein
MEREIFGAVLALIVGGAGWLGMRFLVDPYRELRDIRKSTHEAVFFHFNIGIGTDLKFVERAKDELRRLVS